MKKTGFSVTAGAILVTGLLLFSLGLETLWALVLPILAHELGHILALRLCGMRIKTILAETRGLCISYSGCTGTAGHMLCAAAGPLGGLLYAVAAVLTAKKGQADFWNLSAGISVLLSLFNLLPVLPLDGGRIFACFAWSLLGGRRGDKLLKAVGLVTGTGLLILGSVYLWLGYGPALCLAAIWLLINQPEPETLVKRKELL